MTTTIANGECESDGPGRPSSYSDEYPDQARKLCKLGAIDDELADFFGVDVRTIHRWKLRHPKFAKAIKAGKSLADERVLRALYQRATGFTFRETKVMQWRGSPVFAEVDTFVIPDTRAALAWLVNRCGWRMNPTGAPLEDEAEPTAVRVDVVDGRLPAPDNADPD